MLFSEQSLDFLIENRMRNDRIWYQQNKETFIKYVLVPMQDLVENLAPVIEEIDSQLICEPKIGRSISRVHRDTRFSKDKTVFRDHMWCSFMRDKKVYNGLPGFYFEISPMGFSCGCGYYRADTESMMAMRRLVVNRDKTFIKAHNAVKKQNIFTIEGEKYKRSKFPNEKEEYKNWLDRKTICLCHYSDDFDLLFSDRLAEWLSEKFKSIEPVYHFFTKAESQKIKGIL